MWILESEGEALKGTLLSKAKFTIAGKKYWLRPGQEYTMGRLPRTFLTSAIVNCRVAH
jgi:hypothetical protein